VESFLCATVREARVIICFFSCSISIYLLVIQRATVGQSAAALSTVGVSLPAAAFSRLGEKKRVPAQAQANWPIHPILAQAK
jgi:hypothetical protein